MVLNVVQCKCCDLVTQTRNCPPKSSCLGKCPVLLQSIVNIITVHIQNKAMKKIILKSFSRANLSDDYLAPKSTKESSQSQKHPFSVFFLFLFYQITSNDFSSRAWAETTLASILAGAYINKLTL